MEDNFNFQVDHYNRLNQTVYWHVIDIGLEIVIGNYWLVYYNGGFDWETEDVGDDYLYGL